MKKILLHWFFYLAVTGSVYAQAPEGFNYQAVIRDSQGNVLPGQQVGLQVGIVAGAPDGDVIYKEIFTPVTSEIGLVHIVIGHGSALIGDFSAVPWGDGPLFVRLSVDAEGGTDYLEMGTSQLLSVPYALHAETSADAFSGDYDELVNLPDLDAFISFPSPQQGDMLVYDGSGWQAIPIGEEGQLLTMVEGMPQWLGMDDAGTVTDIDGNVYAVIEMNEMEWMAENLRVTHYNNGDPIPNVTDPGDWSQLSTGAYVVYANDGSHADTFGKLYNWYAVDDDRGLCPAGWRVPADDEFEDLRLYLDPSAVGNDNNAGGKLKATGTLGDNGGLWTPPNTAAIDAYGFSALPGGGRFQGGGFAGMHDLAWFWSATPTPSDVLQRAWIWYMSYNTDTFYRNNYHRREGYAVRCVRED